MSDPGDRVGVFLVRAEHVAAAQKREAAVSALEFPEHGGEYPNRAWRIAQHELFEWLREVSVAQRLLPGDVISAVADLVSSMDKRNPRAFSDASPAARRGLVTKHLTRVKAEALRSALREVLACAEDPEAGLWIAFDVALEPEPTVSAESDDDGAESTGGGLSLEEYVASADRRWMRDEPTESSYHAYLCELSDDDASYVAEAWRDVDADDVDAVVRAADQAAGRCRRVAIESVEEANRTTVDALETLCSRTRVVPSLARNIYTAAQAGELLAWLERQRKSAGRDLVLASLRRAVEHHHGFAIVFHGS